MYKLKYFECLNFIGLYNGLQKKKLIIDLEEFLDKSLVLICGGNAHGKSTLESILHPFSGTTDKRDKFIRKDKEGYKELIYQNIEDNSITIRIRHVYTPNKSQSHNTKSFIYKCINGDEIDLNPSGNVSSFLTAIMQEFGINEDFLKLSAQNTQMTGIVKMTDGVRKDYIYNFIPQADDNTIYQRIISNKLRDVRTYLSSTVDKIGKLPDRVTLYEKLKEVEESINELVEKRDKTIGKINVYKSQISSLDPDDKLMESYKTIRSELKDINTRLDKAVYKHSKIIEDIPKYSQVDVFSIDKYINNTTKNISLLSTEINKLEISISYRKQTKGGIYDSISDKESMLGQLSSDKSISEISELLKTYQKDIDQFDNRLKSLNTSMSSNDLIRGIDILGNMREYLFDIYNAASDSKSIIQAIELKNAETKFNICKTNLDNCKSDIDKLSSSIHTMSTYTNESKGANTRPINCIIDDCPFLQDYNRIKELESKMTKFQSELSVLLERYAIFQKEYDDLQEIIILQGKIHSLVSFYSSNYQILGKLPLNDKYSTKERLLERVCKRDTLVGVEEPFYDIIEILQDKEKYDDIRNIKIPRLMDEKRNLATNQSLIDNLTKDIKVLNTKYESELEEINKETDALNIKKDLLEEYETDLSNLEELKERLTTINEVKKELLILTDKFDKIKDTSERINQLTDELNERKDKLKNIETKLKPLSQLRDELKYGEIQLKEYEYEKEILEENYKILEIMQKALSTTKGMPVHVIKMYIDTIRKSANILLSECYDGTLYLEKFEIDDKKFAIPFVHGGENVDDVSFASDSEKSFISTALSMSIIEQVIYNYGILLLDEVDAGMSQYNKKVYANILMKQMKRIGINQCFFITHGIECYEKYNNDICFILFPEHNLAHIENYSYIKVY